MVDFLNLWAQKVIIVVIVCTIIEMILPEGKNKKYIKTVIGIYIVFTIISPIASKINKDISLNLEDYLNLNNNNQVKSVSSNINTNEYIESVYKEKIEEDIKAKITKMNYKIEKISLTIETENEEKYGTILNINLKISENKKEDKIENKNQIKIEDVVINESISNNTQEESIAEEEKDKIKKFLASEYSINLDNINIE